MAALLITDIQKYIGTAVERAALATGSLKAGSEFYEWDTKLTYKWNGALWKLYAPASVPGSGAVTFATFTDQDDTPSIAGGDHFKTANTIATTITNFDDPAAGGHRFTLLFGDALTTIQANANIDLMGPLTGVPDDDDFGTSAVGDIMEFLYDGSKWWEVSRILNS